MKIFLNTGNMKFFECLSSCTRIKILELLGKGPKNIGELAKLLNVSSAIVTRHILMLEEAGLIKSESIRGKRGLQKVCSLCENEITICLKGETKAERYNYISIPVGQYEAYGVSPPCGLASENGMVGICDDPRYFSDPSHVKAALIWFKTGFVEYRIPSYILPSMPIKAIEISLEICSEFPGYRDDWPSDIHFYLNSVFIGMWQSPGDFGGKRGVYTPEWWKMGTQYGLLKTIRVTGEMTTLDGIKMSDVTLNHIPIKYGEDLFFRICVPEDASHPGGINIFGRGFGNYDQDIRVYVEIG